ncbi:DUF59 domain-containing protein [Pararhodospirillum photometricum]|uniref:MIP18 family-like domain-containing protein n=1 Tax=Pararhodospirillum photometricum DSM 122 TaxID=1150469 RepID=H6SRZ0_PARPM|nr:DUF59 domain-containing protein [Pararhodospirillum photometricum]CCG07669.1 Putative uncharacterized protein [Pararhodospirillum photometricum DSM 122]
MMPPYALSASPMDPPEEGEVARCGTPLEPGTPAATVDAVIDVLREIYDPEIPVNIYDLGLIYDVSVEADGTCKILMTLTAPACPVAGTLPPEMAQRVAAIPGVGEVIITLAWDPPWTPERMSEVARVALDMF